METHGVMNSLYRLTEWIMKLAYINLLWLVFSVLGLIIFGFFPATIAMFHVMRELIIQKENLKIFHSFKKVYKKELLKGNLLGLSLTFIVYFLCSELNFIVSYDNTFLNMLFLPLLIFTFIVYFAFLYVVPLYIYYDNKIIHHVKNSFVILAATPIATLFMIAGCIAIYFINMTFPIVILFFSGSVISFIIMSTSLHAFQKFELKKEIRENVIDQ